jgi:hypothetical protein
MSVRDLECGYIRPNNVNHNRRPKVADLIHESDDDDAKFLSSSVPLEMTCYI